MKMHKMATKMGGIVRGVFTDTIFLQVKLTFNKDVFGGIIETAVKDCY